MQLISSGGWREQRPLGIKGGRGSWEGLSPEAGGQQPRCSWPKGQPTTGCARRRHSVPSTHLALQGSQGGPLLWGKAGAAGAAAAAARCRRNGRIHGGGSLLGLCAARQGG